MFPKNRKYGELISNKVMDIEYLRDYCLSKAAVSEEFPFDDTTLVFKVMGKVFALCPLAKDPLRINLKCDPERAEELRESYDSIEPGFHMNKKHWNTLYLEGDVSDKLVLELIDHSYELVVSKFSKKLRMELQQYEG